MYTLEERIAAVKMYIECGYREGSVIAALGYPSPNTLRKWYREYAAAGSLHEKSASKPRYTVEQQKCAVEYVSKLKKVSLTQACVELGYPTRSILKKWIQELRPEILQKDVPSCKKKHNHVKYTQEEKLAAVKACVIDHEPDYRVAARFGVSKAAVWNWKKQLLGKVSVTSMTKENAKPKQIPPITEETKRELEAEVKHLNEEIYQLRMERDALEMATKLLKKQRASI